MHRSSLWISIVVVAVVAMTACKKSGSEGTAGSASGSAEPVGPGSAPPPADIDAAAGSAGSAAGTGSAEDPTAKIEAAMPAVRKIATDAAVIKAIKEQNGKKPTLDAIKQLDAEWSAAAGVTDEMKPFLSGKCVDALKKHAGDLPAMVEAFAMDNQGALVCSINKTSDYWQGDEDKWTRSFAEGKGADFIDKPRFDESSQTYSVQVSLPVKDGDKAIGAVTIGLSLDKL